VGDSLINPRDCEKRGNSREAKKGGAAFLPWREGVRPAEERKAFDEQKKP